jgi:hypothetical protein
MISGNGEFVVITTKEKLTNDPSSGGFEQVYLRALVNGTTTRITNGTSSNQAHDVSADGRYVLFKSNGSYSPADTDLDTDLYRWDSITGEYLLVSPCLPSYCSPVFSDISTMSANGTRITMNVLWSVNTSTLHSVIYDVASNTYLKMPFVAQYGAILSDDGDIWTAVVLLPENSTIYQAVAYRISTGQMEVLSQNAQGQRSNNGAGLVWTSNDGTAVSFQANASNLRSFVTGCSFCPHAYTTNLSFVGALVPTPTYAISPTPSATLTPSPTFTPSNTPFVPTPGEPGLISPANGATLYDMRVPLSWNNTGASAYLVQVSGASNFHPLVEGYTQSVSGTSTISVPLADGIYYWRVCPQGGAGIWSQVRRFSVLTSVTPTPSATPGIPNAPSLGMPANNATVSEWSPLFSWFGDDNSVRYETQLATTNDFATLVFTRDNLTIANLYLADLSDLPDGAYFWRVRGINANNQFSTWSVAQRFILDATGIQIAPVMVSPAKYAVFNRLSVPLRWNAVAGTATYRVQVGRNANLEPYSFYEFFPALRVSRLMLFPCLTCHRGNGTGE